MAKKSKKSWQGRLGADADEATSQLLASIDVDATLYKYDIAGSIAHATSASSPSGSWGRSRRAWRPSPPTSRRAGSTWTWRWKTSTW